MKPGWMKSSLTWVGGAARVLGLMLSLTLTLVTACGQSAPDTKTDTSVDSDSTLLPWPQFAEKFLQDTHDSLPHVAVARGLHEFDGVQTDYSAAGIAARIRLFGNAIEQANSYELAQPQWQYDRELLLWYARSQLFWLTQAKQHARNVTSYFGALSPDIYASRDYAPLPQRFEALIKHTRNIPNLVRQMRANLATPLPKPHLERAQAYFAGMVEYYENVLPQLFSEVSSTQQQQQFSDASQAAMHAFRNTLVWLQQQQNTAQDNFRLGPDLYLTMLQQTQRVDMTLAEFKMLGERELQRNTNSLELACQEFGDFENLSACIAAMRQHKPTLGTVERARQQLVELQRFVQAQDLVSIPVPGQAQVAVAPPHRRGNLAYINLRGPYEDERVASTYYVAPPNPSWSPAEQLAYTPAEADLMYISIHEVWPGHYLHGLYLATNTSSLRAVLGSGGFKEGWAHYSEELMWEVGFGAQDPRLRIAQLYYALLRNVRYLCSFGMHVENMSQQACQQLFVDKAFQDPGNARQQAARGTYDAGYYVYTLHKILIRKLREQWSAGRADVGVWKAFHDELLSLGAPPTSLAAQYLLP